MEQTRQHSQQQVQFYLLTNHQNQINAALNDQIQHPVQFPINNYNNIHIHNEQQQFAERTIIRGNSNLVWIFIIQNINQSQKNQIQNLYSRGNKIPICSNIEQAQKFLRYQNYETSLELIAFKFIVDKTNARDLLNVVKRDNRILEVNLFLPQEIDGRFFFNQLNRESREIFARRQTNLSQLIRTNTNQILNSRRFTQNSQGKIFLDNVKQELHPPFIKLNGVSNSQITKYIKYRRALYQAIVMQKNQRKMQLLNKLKQYLQKKIKELVNKGKKTQIQKKEEQLFIKEFYDMSLKIIKKQSKNPLLNYQWNQHMQDQAKQQIQFYSSQSFIVDQINSMLRQTLNSQKLFQIPFSHIYKSIRYFFKKSQRQILQTYENDDNIRPIRYLYRTFLCDPKLIATLTKGDFFQILGFVSTSKNKLKAVNNFRGIQNYYFFKIDISILSELNISNDILKFEHGMIDFKKSNIQWRCEKDEEQVLINALNVFKVLDMECFDKETGQTFIEIKYGSILEIMAKQKRGQNLQPKQREALKNYKYCSKILEDNFELERLKKKKARQEEIFQIDDHLKMVQLYQKQGNLTQAYKNAVLIFQNMNQDVDEFKIMIKRQNQNDKQQLRDRREYKENLQVNQQSCSGIFVRLEDYQYSERCLKNLIQLYYEKQNWLKKAQILQKKAYLQKMRGKQQQSIQTYQQCEQVILKQMFLSYQQRQNQINSNYRCNTIKLKLSFIICCQSWKTQIDNQQKNRINQISQVKNKKSTAFLTPQYKKGLELLQLTQNSLVQLGKKTKNHKLQKKYVAKLQQTQQVINGLPRREDFQRYQIQLLSNVSIEYMLQKSQIQFNQIKRSFIQQITSNINNQSESDLLIKTCTNLSKLTFSRIRPQSRLNSQSNLPNGVAPVIVNKENFQQNNRLIEQALTQSKLIQSSQQRIRYSQNPKLEQISNCISYLYFLQNNLQRSKQMLEQQLHNQNTKKQLQGAKKFFLLSQIALKRGQIKEAFKKIDITRDILKTALVKDKNKQQYWAIYDCFPMKYQIDMHFIKVYNAQLRSDLSLIIINNIQQRFFYGLYSEEYLIQLFTEKGKIGLNKQNFYQYEKNMKIVAQKILQQRKYCSQTLQAICCIYIQCILNKRNKYQYLENAHTILNYLDENHPSLWIYFYSISLQQKHYDHPSKEKQYLIKSNQLIQKKFQFAKQSITYIKYKYLIMRRLWQLKGTYFQHVNNYGPIILSQQLTQLVVIIKNSLKQSKKRLKLQQDQNISPEDDKRKLYQNDSERLNNEITIYSINQANLLRQNQQSIQELTQQQE